MGPAGECVEVVVGDPQDWPGQFKGLRRRDRRARQAPGVQDSRGGALDVLGGGSVTAAARALHRSQPVVSHRAQGARRRQECVDLIARPVPGPQAPIPILLVGRVHHVMTPAAREVRSLSRAAVGNG